MNYNEIIYTHPIPCVAGHTEELKVNKGDSYFITLKECSAPEMNFSPAREDIARNTVIRNTLYLSERHHSIGDIVTEGNDITITIKLAENAAQDVVVDWSISHGVVFHNGELINHKANVGDFDYTTLHRNSVDADFTTLNGQATILTGTDSVDVVISTVDDALWTGGENTYKVATFSVDNVSDGNLLLERTQVGILIEDSSPTPVFENVVELWVRMGHPDDCHLEPLGGRSDKVTFNIGYDDNGDSLLESSIFDDTDTYSIAFKTMEDPVAPNGEDITNATLYYKAQIKSGRRLNV